jgi:PAS domain S-box-containing protein
MNTELSNQVLIKKLVELIKLPILINEKGKIIINNEAEKLIDYSSEEFEDLNWTKIIQFKENKIHKPNKKNKVTILRKDGNKQKIYSFCLISGEIEAFVLFEDHENVFLEENLNDRGKILSLIYDNSSDIMFLVNIDSNNSYSFLSVNNSFADITGIPKVKCIGKRLESVFPSEISNKLIVSFRWTIMNKRPLVSEGPLKLNNEIRFFDSSMFPIFDKSEKCIYILVVAHDFTERKKKEDEFIFAKNLAEESNRLKDALLSNMNHEIRTPLTGILGFAELLEDGLKGTEYSELAYFIRKAGRRLLDTLHSIIELSRLESENIDVYKTTINVDEIINKISEKFKPEAELKGLFYKIEFRTSNINLHIDGSLFTQILNNLLDNAVKFTNTGGIIITVDSLNEEGKNFLVIKVIDTGIGISEKNIKTIFSEFKQESEGWGRSYEGMGLGLTIAKRMTELMGGIISVESKKNNGSVFSLKLPSYVDQPVNTNYEFVPPKQEIPSMNFQLPLVLLVEDNELNSIVTKLYLKDLFIVDHAPDALTSFKMVKEKLYEIILMDINLGDGMNGVDAVKEIRKIAEYSNIPIIALTGYAFKNDRDNLLSCGFTHYIAKPFEKKELINIMNEILAPVLE